MSSLGIFNKETKTYQKVAGTAEAAVVDAEMSDTSTNTVQNKVIKKYVDDHRAEEANSVTDYNNDNVNIKIGYYGDGLRVDQIRHIAGFTGDGVSDIRIKDIPKDELKSWIGDATTSAHGLMTPAMVSKLKAVNETVDELKKSVSDGKTKVANAITDKGVETATDATFDVMAENISKIETGGGELHGATISGNTEEEVLFGKDVQLILNEKVIRTTTVNSDGTFSFTDIQEIGLYRVYASNGTESDYSDIEITPEHIINKTVLNVTIEFLHIVTWADGTWKQIKKMLNAHYAGELNVSDYWATGDIREQTVMATSITTEQKVKLILGDFSHHKLKTPIGTRDTSAITVIQSAFKEVTNINAGKNPSPISDYESFEKFSLFTWLQKDYANAIPSELNNMVKECVFNTWDGRNIYKPNDRDKIHYISAKYCAPSVAEFNGNYTIPHANIIFNSTNERNAPLAYIVNSGMTGLKINNDSYAWLRNVYSHLDVGNMACTTRAILDNNTFGNCVNYDMKFSIVPIFCL